MEKLADILKKLTLGADLTAAAARVDKYYQEVAITPESWIKASPYHCVYNYEELDYFLSSIS